MNDGRKVAVVLGGTAAHIALLKELKGRGYYTVLVDYYLNPVAAPFADVHIRESTMNQEKVLEIARYYDADLVLSTCVDQANITACYVMEALGKTPPYTYETALSITDKLEMKRVMLESGIPTSRQALVGDGIPDVSSLCFPIMVKPVNCCGATGVKKCEDMEQFKEYYPFAVECSRDGRALVEEFVSGVEVSAYFFVTDGEPVLLSTAERLSVLDGPKDVLKCYGTIMPSSCGEDAIAKIKKAAGDIVRCYSLDNTPLHVQAIVDGDSISLLEFAPRVGGGLSYITVRKRTGFDVISAAVDSWEGKRVQAAISESPVTQIIHLIYAKPGYFGRIEVSSEILEDRLIDALFEYKSTGVRIGEETASAGRVGAFVVSGVTQEEAFAKIRRAFAGVRVFSTDDEDITQRNLSIADLYTITLIEKGNE
ncbi:ATP-grasp domain-containing protein [Adlercreutzia sp. ZJ473]|uniref:ATP-grasp domain-containing protein n=1 Tax=Adlercreutzia sp. ZJ473 TaxID=2722822 RepID=UPI001555A69A|nr:ATP-grasp domain-containing protein [Adlercreutzia sp. ZJ473]